MRESMKPVILVWIGLLVGAFFLWLDGGFIADEIVLIGFFVFMAVGITCYFDMISPFIDSKTFGGKE